MRQLLKTATLACLRAGWAPPIATVLFLVLVSLVEWLTGWGREALEISRSPAGLLLAALIAILVGMAALAVVGIPVKFALLWRRQASPAIAGTFGAAIGWLMFGAPQDLTVSGFAWLGIVVGGASAAAAAYEARTSHLPL